MIPPMKEFVSLGDCIINLNQIAFVQNFPAGCLVCFAAVLPNGEPLNITLEEEARDTLLQILTNQTY